MRGIWLGVQGRKDGLNFLLIGLVILSVLFTDVPKRRQVNKWELSWHYGCSWVSESSRHSLSMNSCLLLFYKALVFYVLLQPLWSRISEPVPQIARTPHQETSPTAWRCYHPFVACASMIHRRTRLMGKGLGLYMGPKISMMDFSWANTKFRWAQISIYM